MTTDEETVEQLVLRQALHDRREAIKTQISAHKAVADLRTEAAKAVIKEYEAQLAACQRLLSRVGGLS